MKKIILTDENKEELKKCRGQAESRLAEKALMVQLSSEGLSMREISRRLHRTQQTVTRWLRRYAESGVSGLKSLPIPGAPDPKRRLIKQHLKEIENKTPLEYGYQANCWTVDLMIRHLEVTHGVKVSVPTVTRALADAGYSYRRPKKGVSSAAPSKEQKEAAMKNVTEAISNLMTQKDCVVVALDESHFTNEPYIVRGWQKKR